MRSPEFMRIPIKLIPDEFIQEYKLKEKEVKGYIYMKIIKGVYSLPQAGCLAINLLKKKD